MFMRKLIHKNKIFISKIKWFSLNKTYVHVCYRKKYVQYESL